MIPVDKVREIISKHELLENKLSSDKIDKKNFAKISKEYSDLNEVVINAKQYLSYDVAVNDLEKILNEPGSDQEMKDLAKREIEDLKKKSPDKVRKIAIETSSDLIKQVIGVDVNNSSISAIVEDISRKRN